MASEGRRLLERRQWDRNQEGELVAVWWWLWCRQWDFYRAMVCLRLTRAKLKMSANRIWEREAPNRKPCFIMANSYLMQIPCKFQFPLLYLPKWVESGVPLLQRPTSNLQQVFSLARARLLFMRFFNGFCWFALICSCRFLSWSLRLVFY